MSLSALWLRLKRLEFNETVPRVRETIPRCLVGLSLNMFHLLDECQSSNSVEDP